MKKIGLIIFLILFVSFMSVSIFKSPSSNDFSINLEVDNTEYHVGDVMDVTMTFRNHSIGIYQSVFMNQVFNLSVKTPDENVAYLLLPKRKIILPFQSIKEVKQYTFSETGSYIVLICSSFSSEGQTFYMTKSLTIEVIS